MNQKKSLSFVILVISTEILSAFGCANSSARVKTRTPIVKELSVSLGELKVEKIVEDIASIFSAIRTEQSYVGIKKGAPNLSIHLLPYLNFLEQQEYIVFDREAAQISLSSKGKEEMKDSANWRDQANARFQYFVAESSFEFPNDQTQANEVQIIGVDDGLEIIEIDVLTEIETLPEIETKPQPPLEPIVTKDTFSSRKLSTNDSSVEINDANAYTREDLIGSGAYGSVFKAKQVKLNRYVALKEVKSIFDVFATMPREEIVARFANIIQQQASLLHPNIMQVIDFEMNAAFPFVIMQYAPNGNLRRVIDHEKRPDLQISLKYFFQILHAINTAHDQGITHGGIKPENVVLDHAGNALVTDFGISNLAASDTQTGANQIFVGVGTIAYMSPEQFKNPNTSSVKSDIYSLGIMFYEMLTGKVPGRRSPMPSSFFPDIPRKIDDIFDRMSMDDPDERYDSIEEILRDLYNTPEIMAIIDKRGGFLFLRDPIEYGVVGIEGLTKHVEEDLPDAGDGDILNKLDKYGAMFDGEE